MIKKLREDQGLLQRQIASELDIDTPMYSKFERGERLPKKEQLAKLAKILQTDNDRLRELWLADKLFKTAQEDKDICCAAIEIAREHLYNENVR